ncbi:MAG: LysM peptidoglycan-binding domain-containing protein [Desulfonatronovibrionaceae bacterium]
MERKNWINKLDELEGDSPAPRTGRKNSFNLDLSRENLLIYGLAGAGLLIIVLLAVILASGGNSVSSRDMQELRTRIHELEERFTRISGAESGTDQFFAQVVQTQEEQQVTLEEHQETLDDLRQQIAGLDKQEAGQGSADRGEEKPSGSAAGASAGSASADDEAAENRIHEVQSGDNLFRIGLKYDISVDAIRKLNDLSPDDSIQPGQKLIVGPKKD